MVGDLLSQLPFLQSAATRAILNLPVYIGPIWACSKCGGINGPVNAAPFLYGINIMVHISRNGGGECGVTGPAGIPGIAAPPAKTPLREKPPTGLAASAVRHQQSNRARQRQTGGGPRLLLCGDHFHLKPLSALRKKDDEDRNVRPARLCGVL